MFAATLEEYLFCLILRVFNVFAVASKDPFGLDSLCGRGGAKVFSVGLADYGFMATQKPVHEVRLGAIKAAIWRNDTEKGVRYNTTFSRLYRDGDDWKN